MKKVLVVLATLLFVGASVNAQDKFYPGWYLGVQGGANYVTSNNWSISHFKHISPNGQISVGYDFTPVFGLRGSISGPMGYYPTNGTNLNAFYYGQLALDATFDICNIFRYKETRFFNPYIFLGAGANYRLAANDQAGSFSPAVRAGLGFDFRLSELVDLSLEFQDNALNNKFNTLEDNTYFGGEILKIKKPFKWDDNFAALIGLKFNIGSVKKKAAVRAAEAAAAEAAALAAAKAAAEKAAAEKAAAEKAEAERLAAERAAAEKAAAEKAAAEKAAAARAAARAQVENIYFDLDKYVIKKEEAPKVDHIVAVLNEFPDAVVTVSGYADKQTGKPKHNMTLSQNRAERVAKALKDAGIAASRITVNYYGDTVQVSDVREENRVAVVVTK
ncbi:MAG: OmpA family protein [Bacteroidales bacterium]|nr:OmpA family protein [Bacteroidales bacterium]